MKPEKRKEKWNNDARELERKSFNGFDIRSHFDDTKREMEALYGVKITEDEEKFYTDNCSLVDEHDNPLEKCARLRWCGKVDSKSWKRMLKSITQRSHGERSICCKFTWSQLHRSR